MTNLKKWLLAPMFALVVGGSFVAVGSPAPVFAAGCGGSFLTFPTWYRGLDEKKGADCEIKSPTAVGGIRPFIITIIANVIEIALQLVAYISVGFIIYGGYLYMIGTGTADKMVSARKTILNAIIGLVISFFSIAIVNLVAGNIK